MPKITPYLGWTRHRFADDIKANGWGLVWVSGQTSYWPEPTDKWFYDNGAFRDWRHGLPFNRVRFLLDQALLPANCSFGLLPDRVGEGEKSLTMSMEYLPHVRTDWPWLLPLQDEMTVPMVESVIHEVDGLFLGGTNGFKAEAGAFSELAAKHDKHFHYGRCGTLKKLRAARHLTEPPYRCDSLDTSLPLWSEERWDKWMEWHLTPDPQTDWIAQSAKD